MKVAYLILAHNNPKLLKRTIEKLSTQDSDFFIHIDKKSDINLFADLRRDGVFFIPDRVKVYWGEYSQVEAILRLLRHAFKSPAQYDYFMLISGADYPLKSGKYINDFFSANAGAEFINLVKMPSPGKPIERMTTRRYPSNKPLRRFIFRVLAKLGWATMDHTKVLGALDCYSGHTWWALSRKACDHLLWFVNTNPEVLSYFGKVFAPDESMIHTILGNAPHIAPKIRRNLNLEFWSGGAHPATINEGHVKWIESQGKVYVDDVYGCGEVLMARKFSDDSMELLDRIDAAGKPKLELVAK